MLRALQRSVEKGWLASRPTRDCRYDLVLDDGERLYRVQVKYAGRRAVHCQGAVSLDFTKGGRRDRTYLIARSTRCSFTSPPRTPWSGSHLSTFTAAAQSNFDTWPHATARSTDAST